jgi:hypothetical protein
MPIINKKFLKIFCLLIFSFFIVSCGRYKVSPVEKIITLSEDKVYTGKIWWKIEIFKKDKIKSNGGYADFQVSQNFLYISLKSPFNSMVALIKWEKEKNSRIDVYDFYNKKHFIIFLPQNFKNNLLPFYFLGLKKKEMCYNFFKMKIKYMFLKDKNTGYISCPYFRAMWKIKTLMSAEKRKFKYSIDKHKFKEIRITL